MKQHFSSTTDTVRPSQDMHQSHQTRLTALTNQLKQQHAQSINELKSGYEERLIHQQKSGVESLNYKLQVESITKVRNTYVIINLCHYIEYSLFTYYDIKGIRTIADQVGGTANTAS